MITLYWKQHIISDTKYYYTFHKEKFWCVKAEYVSNGIADPDFVFQVTASKMDQRTKNALIQRLANLFQELNAEQIKNALYYDKKAVL